jgi:hypothetical protein
MAKGLFGLVETGPDLLAETRSLGSIIAGSNGAPVHILFVHGIRTGDRGSSTTFRNSLCMSLKGIGGVDEPVRTELNHRLLQGAPNPGVTYMGEPVFPADDAWRGSAPFVDRYEYARAGGRSAIVVDEVNWWPLALPLRCMAVLAPEAELAGPDEDNLRLCAAVDRQGQPLSDEIHYPHLSKGELERLLRTRPKGGGAAWLNGRLKRSLVDWGLSDAVIALGPMRKHLHDAIDQAFAYAAGLHPEGGPPATFVVVAESLGSFIVFDAYGHGKAFVQKVLDRTACLYFFANQLGLLELGRLSQPDQTLELQRTGEAPSLSVHKVLKRWAAQAPRPHALDATPPRLRQIIAFSDPSDALTFRVPAIPDAKVVNVHDRNGFRLWPFFADPAAAQTGHGSNRRVLKLMLRQ